MSEFRDRVMAFLDYNPETGIFIWKKAPRFHPEVLGREAGGVIAGYLKIKIDGKKYSAHRLAWLIVHGTLPPLVDHKNRNTLDNRIENLREATRLGNSRNHGRTINRSGLPVGVRAIPSGRFQARIRDDGRAVHLGAFNTSEEASTAYQSARRQIFGEFCPL